MPLVPSVPVRGGLSVGFAVDRASPGGSIAGGSIAGGSVAGGSIVERFLDGGFCQAAGSLAGGISLFCGATLALRRCTGSIAALPDPFALLAVCATGILLVVVGDMASRAAGRVGMSGRFGTIATRAGLMTAVLAMTVPMLAASDRPSLPGTVVRARPAAGPGSAAVVAAAAATAAAILGPLTRARGAWPRRGRSASPPNPPQRPAAGPPAPDIAPPPAAAGPLLLPCPGHLLQRLERYERPDGADCLRGQVLITLAAGARAAHAHVGFCPPFAETPAVRVSTDHDGLEAVVSATEVLPWGVRVECRLDEPADETVEVPVDLLVQWPA